MINTIAVLFFWWSGLVLPTSSFYLVDVNSTHLDYNGHMSNYKAIGVLQVARDDWRDERGMFRSELVKAGCVPLVVRAEIDYKRQATLNDRLVAVTVLDTIGTSSYVLKQYLYKDDMIVVRARMVIVNYDPIARKSKPFPAELRRMITK